MAKPRTRFVCQQCGATQLRWMGRCPECGAWNAMVEQVIEEPPSRSSLRAARGTAISPAKAQPLAKLSTEGEERLPIPMEELSRVLGGGLVPGSVTLVGGDPGIGKSTLLLQLAGLMGREGAPALYVSGEESPQQIKMRAERLGIVNPHLYV
ncbi:MAG: AAA family ATPase, partial [Chloroflexi bacterium]|nr:AAA family ATPase [Chloroflexota bacterium]